MNTQFITKTLTPAASQLRTPFEVWGYNLLNSGVVGGATAVTSSIGLVIVHSSGVQDVPMLNWHIFATLFVGGALGKIMMFLSQGLPKIQDDSNKEP